MLAFLWIFINFKLILDFCQYFDNFCQRQFHLKQKRWRKKSKEKEQISIILHLRAFSLENFTAFTRTFSIWYLKEKQWNKKRKCVFPSHFFIAVFHETNFPFKNALSKIFKMYLAQWRGWFEIWLNWILAIINRTKWESERVNALTFSYILLIEKNPLEWKSVALAGDQNKGSAGLAFEKFEHNWIFYGKWLSRLKKIQLKLRGIDGPWYE